VSGSRTASDGKAAGAAGSPYTDAKRVYIERTAGDIRTAVFMRRLTVTSLAALCLSLLAIVVLATKATVVPVYIHDNAQGRITYVGRAPEGENAPSSAAIRAQLADWISNAREISSDPMATRERQRRVAALVLNGSQAQTFLKVFFAKNDPFTLGFQRRVAVALSFVAAIGKSTDEYEAEWTESARDASGRQMAPPKAFHGRFTIVLAPLGDEARIYANPLGLFIAELDWSEKIH
jgi:type IV secretion system protein VirB5